jgi:hypothetical protein
VEPMFFEGGWDDRVLHEGGWDQPAGPGAK